jgi:hypothetical protein
LSDFPVWLGRKVRAPIWMGLQLLRASFDGDMGRFVDRSHMTPLRLFFWRLALSVVIVIQFAVMVLAALVVGIGGAVVLPTVLAIGNLCDTWQRSARGR